MSLLNCADDSERLRTLAGYHLLDTPPEPNFDRITSLAARLFEVPIALITLVDQERQWFKSCVGLEITGTDRNSAFCAYTILRDEVFVVSDAAADPRFRENPLVTGKPFVRFYAGAPLVTADGFRLGSLCLIDTVPRTFDARQAAMLRDLAAVVIEAMEARRNAERVAAETEQRRQAEARKNAVLDAALDAIVTIDSVGKVLELNRAAEEMFGYPAAQAVGQELAELIIPPAYREAHRRGMAHFLATGEGPVLNKRLELSAVRADGSEFPVELAITRIAAGGPPIFTGYIRDISARRATENRLRMLESSVENANDAVIITEAEPVDGLGPQILYVNKAFTKATGYTAEEAIGQTPRILQGPKTDPEAKAKIRRALKRWKPVRVELLNYRKDGSEFWVELNIVPVANEKGWYTHWVSVQRDVTERRQAQKQIEDRDHLLSSVIDGTDNIIFLKDLQGRYLLINPAGANILGCSPQDVIGKDDNAFFSSEDARQIQAFDQQILAEDRPITSESQDVIGGIEHVFLSTKSPYRDAAGTPVGVIGIVREVTEARRAADALKQAKEEAERANHAKSDFLSRMSHELRTPLNAILGFGQLLEMGGLGDGQGESVNHILKAGRHLLNLIDEVLAISRIEAGRMRFSLEPVAVVEIVQECLALVRRQGADRALQFVDRCDASGAYVQADRQRLRQVLLNLLSNAIKYNREGGSVTLTCVETTGTAGDQSDSQPSRYQRIEIADTGHGLSAEEIGRLFTPFERLRAERTATEGTGLGLALSKGLIETMNGRIGVSSTLGEGSIFWIELPLVVDPSEQLARERLALPGLPKEVCQGCVLYIEDNLSNLRLIEMLLGSRPRLDLLSAQQGSLGIEIARARQPDLILLDLHLPDIQGWEVLEILQADPTTRDIPVVVISADATPNRIDRLLQAGARAYLAKPFDVPELLETMQEHLKPGMVPSITTARPVPNGSA